LTLLIHRGSCWSAFRAALADLSWIRRPVVTFSNQSNNLRKIVLKDRWLKVHIGCFLHFTLLISQGKSLVFSEGFLHCEFNRDFGQKWHICRILMMKNDILGWKWKISGWTKLGSQLFGYNLSHYVNFYEIYIQSNGSERSGSYTN